MDVVDLSFSTIKRYFYSIIGQLVFSLITDLTEIFLFSVFLIRSCNQFQFPLEEEGISSNNGLGCFFSAIEYVILIKSKANSRTYKCIPHSAFDTHKLVGRVLGFLECNKVTHYP